MSLQIFTQMLRVLFTKNQQFWLKLLVFWKLSWNFEQYLFTYLFNNLFKVDKWTKIQYTYIQKYSQPKWLIKIIDPLLQKKNKYDKNKWKTKQKFSLQHILNWNQTEKRMSGIDNKDSLLDSIFNGSLQTDNQFYIFNYNWNNLPNFRFQMGYCFQT